MLKEATVLAEKSISGVANRQLNRAVWHQPLISIVVTHFNYSAHVRDALLSLLDQTHSNWECVVVDDASSLEHYARVAEIVAEIGCDKIRLLRLPENVGQIPAFFAGVDVTRGEFVCLLDPDDRYAETFLAETVGAHLNKNVVCPIVSTDQYALVDGQITTASMSQIKMRHLRSPGKSFQLPDTDEMILFFPANADGWYWTSTSSLMFRRSALQYLRPHKVFAHKGHADSYLAPAIHLLGGTLFLAKPLVYRTLHDHNDYIRKDLYSSFQNPGREDAGNWSPICRRDAIEALRHNKAPLKEKLSPTSKWLRSFRKRWNRLKRILGAGNFISPVI